jgi:hypothetical protein
VFIYQRDNENNDVWRRSEIYRVEEIEKPKDKINIIAK